MDRSALTGLVVAVAALALASAAGFWWRRRTGALREFRRAAPHGALAALGASAGRVTLLQFSSAFCAPCRTTSRVLGEVAQRHEGVVHIEVDAESHLNEVRELGIWRTPTVLVVDTDGRVAHRGTGVPARSRVEETVSELLGCGAAGT